MSEDNPCQDVEDPWKKLAEEDIKSMNGEIEDDTHLESLKVTPEMIDVILAEIAYLTKELENCEHYDIGFPVNNIAAPEWIAWVQRSLARQKQMLADLNKREKEQKEN